MRIDYWLKSIVEFFSERRLLYTLLTAIIIIDVSILVFSDGFSGGADSLVHYRFARWAFEHPEFLLDHWAKPVFTLLGAPFAMLGFKSFQLFNILFGISAGYLSYLVAKELKIKNALLSLVITCFTPIFMLNLFSGLTEILFAFAAILTSYLLIKEKYSWGAIVLSFLPLIRTEGIVLLPVYALYLVHRKHYREIVYMLTGAVIYSIIGFLAGKNILWLFTEMPYHNAVDLYGKGSIFRFVLRSPGFFGIPNEIFFVTGLVFGLSVYLRERKEYSKEFLLVVLPFITYFIAHSVSWWSGIGSSLGLSRYMAAIVPFMAVMATRGLYLFVKMFLIIFKKKWVRTAASIIGVISIVHIPFAVQNYPVSPGPFEQTLTEAATWINTENTSKGKIFYSDPTLFYYLNIDPNNTQCASNYMPPAERLPEELNDNDILIFDSHFSSISGLQLTDYLNSPHLKLIRVFKPDIPARAFGKPYLIAVFRKTPSDPNNPKHNLRIFSGKHKHYREIIRFDFDKLPYAPEQNRIASSKIHSSNYLRIKRNTKYSLTYEFDLSRISYRSPLELLVKFKLFRNTPDEKLRYVAVAYKNRIQLARKSFEIFVPDTVNPEEWAQLSFSLKFPEIVSSDGVRIKCYLWNKRKGRYLIDDYSISYLESE